MIDLDYSWIEEGAKVALISLNGVGDETLGTITRLTKRDAVVTTAVRGFEYRFNRTKPNSLHDLPALYVSHSSWTGTYLVQRTHPLAIKLRQVRQRKNRLYQVSLAHEAFQRDPTDIKARDLYQAIANFGYVSET